MKNLNFETILKDAENFSLVGSHSYVEVYPEFIKYFDSISGTIDEHHLVISSHFVYGWMPTILNLNLENKGQVLSLLNAVKKGHLLTFDEIDILKKCINNSLVGLSKLLHFINPTDYAIWDSRIFRYITEKKSQYGIGKLESYLEYLQKMKEISKNENYYKIHELVSKHFDYEIQPMRAIEIVMFETDRVRQSKEMTKTTSVS